MYRNLYDTDCITWSPQGRVFQVEYAKQAVTQGTCCVGLRSDSYVVLCSLKKSPSKLAGYQQKLFCIDEHVGVAISGITADAKVLCEIMRNACLQHKFTYDTEKPAARLALLVADKCQSNTQRSGKRPYGVGLLIAACDASGPRLFQNCPSGNYYEYNAVAFGARSQASKTYLEKHFETFPTGKLKTVNPSSLDDLLLHGAKALKASMAADTELTAECLCVGIVGRGQPWRELNHEELQTLVDRLTNAESSGDGGSMAVDMPE
ncbi:proteasome subunit alpha type 1, putative [Eimeria tenella]|uniref:Proteasome subunit alpha type 1, putative n=1 Tax=Eimeria tenella TaxID=5802 RepID=U6L248_EIMTE|nr:proteasome subunit alpha type 1, putative [Eimeria tenella]CDJ43273.1 proteasome subunit alpha type 1, putative [Eimeria tenella]|eukprot:XP_013234023.1 proteasome subunit alpha type 1, putative [Eimeria tenella]